MSRPRFWLIAATALAVALCACGAKLWLVQAYGNPTPYMDQWNGEAAAVYVPYLRGELAWSHLWAAHNEHHIVWTRLLALGLLGANGQWDPLLQMAVNAVLHSVIAAALVVWLGRQFRGAGFALAALLVGAVFALPFAWENTLAGFQSQFYFLVLFALAHLGLTLGARAGGLAWWTGWACGVAGLGASSGGFAAPLASAAVVLLGALLRRDWNRWTWIHLGLAAALAAAGLATVHHVPGHDPLRATSAGQFLLALLNTAGWPANFWLPLGVVVPLPFLFRLWQTWRRRELDPFGATLLGLGAWTLLQCAAIAFSRGNLHLGGSPRYNDLFALQLVAGLAALLRSRDSIAPEWRRAFLVLGTGWCALVAVGLGVHTRNGYAGFLEPLQPEWRRETELVAGYVRGGDRAKFVALDQALLPYPSPELLAGWLDLPEIRRILPAALRAPVKLRADEARTRGFPPGGSALPDGDAVQGAAVWSRAAGDGAAEFRSAPLPADLLPVLQFRFAGDAQLPADALRIESRDGREHAAPAIARWAGTRWQTANLARPAGETVVVARAPAGQALAFAEPVELGRWSWHNRNALKAGRGLFGVAGALLAALLLFAAWPDLRDRALADEPAR